ncbi:putative beta-galactosidase A [Fusarium oxysporum f. sp. raphani]|uniref:Putative beta-galactosidase A n=1 Tax=Fusarium oxysporum f. sp. raphani TaxID=96318 RepID=A0A8J5UEV0_FUSOX|nr:putative beta-galactosidase A [Fusarium oxysporum f. sp. raphani]
MFFSGEVHPFRLPVLGTWLDIFQKLRAGGFSGASFYLMWGLLEGNPGHVRTEGVLALEEFFQAASEAGIYLLARPGPYINAEVSGGGFPGWVQRVKGTIRTNNSEFTESTMAYLTHVGGIIAKAQITNDYMEFIESQLRNAGVTVPFISNDGVPVGNWAPGSGAGAVNIYGMDHYPFSWGVGCDNPSNWAQKDESKYPIGDDGVSRRSRGLLVVDVFLPPKEWFTDLNLLHRGGTGVESCTALINHEFARVFNKLLYGLKATVVNFYMTFGGTNWGNLGHAKGYTSYDVGAAISENRAIDREKYSELKLQGYFFQSSPSYLTSSADNGTFRKFTDSCKVVVTQLKSTKTAYYIVRQADHAARVPNFYSVAIPTSKGKLSVPRLGGQLTLNGRDSKIHVVDYPVGNANLVYSTAEVMAWRRFKSRTVLILYGGDSKTHEFAVEHEHECPESSGGNRFRCRSIDSLLTINWDVQPEGQALRFSSGLEVHLLWRKDAYNYWILDLPAPAPINN